MQLQWKSIFFTIATVFVTTLTVTSCSDDFVDRSPEYSIDSENYFNSKDDYNKALVAEYDLLQSSYLNVLLGEIASDNTLAGGESPTDVIGFQQVDDMIHTPVNSNLRDLWNWMFAGVQRANYILEFKDKTDFWNSKTKLIFQAKIRSLQKLVSCVLITNLNWLNGLEVFQWKGDARFKIGDEKTIKERQFKKYMLLLKRIWFMLRLIW